MVCPNCGKELKDDDLFCSKCGTKQILERKCINCGIKLDEDAVFCPKCGTKQESETIVEDSTSINNYPNRITKEEYNLNQGPIDLEMIQIPGTNFEMLETPVTQKLYETVTGENPSYFNGETNPVEMVNFFDAIIFCNLLSVINRKTPCYSISGDTDVQNWPFRLGDRKHFLNSIKVNFDADGYRLPTDNEWEYAAKGGQNFKHAGSDKLKPVAWYTSNSEEMTHAVKQKLENGFGLYDMNGNVWEWVWSSSYNDIYGGSWKDGRDAWKINTYAFINQNEILNDVGFRIVSGPFYDEGVTWSDHRQQDYEEISFDDLDNDFDDSDSYDEDSYEDDSESDDYEEYVDEDEYEDDETTEEKIRKIVDKYIDVISKDTSTWYRAAAVQDSKYSQVFQNVRVNIAEDISQSEIIGFIDTTIFGKGKNGLLFTTSALYEKFTGTWWKVPYNKMGRMKSNGKQITFEGTEGCGRGLSGIGDIKIDSNFYNIPALKDCLEEIYAII